MNINDNNDNANDEYFLGLVDTPTSPTTMFENMEFSPTMTTGIITIEYNSNNNTNDAWITNNNTYEKVAITATLKLPSSCPWYSSQFIAAQREVLIQYTIEHYK